MQSIGAVTFLVTTPNSKLKSRLFCCYKIYGSKDIWIFLYSNQNIITLVTIIIYVKILIEKTDDNIVYDISI